MPHRNLWLIDMGDGTWAVCCTACRLALYRGPKRVANRVFNGHRCEPVLPLGRRPRPSLTSPDPSAAAPRVQDRSPSTSAHTSIQGAAL